ncbi:TetR/AcrR family transcriptional regulator [Nocardia sp. NPDC101769]|uniref:TetR/AcrR family transcriptional regulator n=1 Tax=Nocardia sp. NPDC101769 TaxID=3364333 RepID=UPI00380EBCF0
MTPRERVLATASKLFYREGIRAVGVDRIAAEANVSKMTLYRHFPTKDDLVVAVLEARDEPAQAMLAAATATGTARDRLLGGFTLLETWFTSKGFRGCPFMNASLELADPGHPARAVAERHKTATSDQFRVLAHDAGIADPNGLADQLAILFDGAIAQAQMRDCRLVARAALAAATTLVDAALGQR